MRLSKLGTRIDRLELRSEQLRILLSRLSPQCPDFQTVCAAVQKAERQIAVLEHHGQDFEHALPGSHLN